MNNKTLPQQRKNVRSTTVTSTDMHNQHYQLHHNCHSASNCRTVLNQYCVKVLICNWNIQKVAAAAVEVKVEVEVVEVIGSELESIGEMTMRKSKTYNSSSSSKLKQQATILALCKFNLFGKLKKVYRMKKLLLNSSILAVKLLKHETDSGLKNQSKNERGRAGGKVAICWNLVAVQYYRFGVLFSLRFSQSTIIIIITLLIFFDDDDDDGEAFQSIFFNKLHFYNNNPISIYFIAILFDALIEENRELLLDSVTK
ncbi:hypothetical protein T07_7587 [Trichinella nelsoni]|uniref:Uncharacterized protein n=1 Tax=Trichinella nelsoni TaxID=6336 RepID=A0A0V0SEX8_9BILA|nr:hypothetical protein T07_7587 [Trichinella nelsoni]